MLHMRQHHRRREFLERVRVYYFGEYPINIFFMIRLRVVFIIILIMIIRRGIDVSQLITKYKQVVPFLDILNSKIVSVD